MFLTPKRKGLVEAVNCGFGFVLMKVEIFKKMPKPWVRLGELVLDEWCDDVGFFNRVRAAGFKIYCDLDIRLGHMINLTLWPGQENGVWTSVYETGTGEKFSFPQITKLT
jgi:hypothetical protein